MQQDLKKELKKLKNYRSQILVVDDEQDVRETLSTVLENLDYEPYLAADGEEALDVIRQKPIDITMQSRIIILFSKSE